MKIKILSLTVLMLLASTSCIYTKGTDGENGSSGFGGNVFSNSGKGEIIEKTYKVDFDDLQISTSLSAEVYKSNKEEIVVYAPSDIMQYVVVKQTGNKVHVKIETQGIKNISTDRVKIKVYTNDFNRIAASSSGSILIKDDFKFSTLDIKISSSGSIKGNVNADAVNIQTSSSGSFDGNIYSKSLNIQTSSSGDVNVKGKVSNVSVQASSSGDVNAKELVAENAVLSASSSADITIGVSNTLTANASSSGDISVIKQGSLSNITKSESSSGSVTIR